jgi:hypothetical protein
MQKFPGYNADFAYPLMLGPEPLPDPNWDYFAEWACTIGIQREIAEILETMDHTDAENRCERVDRAMLDNARQIIAQAEKLKVLIGTALLNADK